MALRDIPDDALARLVNYERSQGRAGSYTAKRAQRELARRGLRVTKATTSLRPAR